MNVKEIKDPAFLRRMDEKELQKLCGELREFIIEGVSHTGGHLSSNLGLVELTVALHRVYDPMKDRIASLRCRGISSSLMWGTSATPISC